MKPLEPGILQLYGLELTHGTGRLRLHGWQHERRVRWSRRRNGSGPYQGVGYIKITILETTDGQEGV